MNSFVLALVAVLCATYVAGSSKEDLRSTVADFKNHREFQYNRATVGFEDLMFAIKRSLLVKASDEQKKCLNEVSARAQKDGQELIRSTVDSVLPKLDEMYAVTQSISSTDEQWNDVQQFVDSLDYTNYKNTCMAKVNAAGVSWLEQKKKELKACRPDLS